MLDFDFLMEHSDNKQLVKNMFFGVIINDFSNNITKLEDFVLSQEQYHKYSQFTRRLAQNHSSDTLKTAKV